MRVFKGVGVSRGIAIGPVFQFKKARLEFQSYAPENPAAEWERFQKSLVIAREKIHKVYVEARAEIGADEAAIFEAHLSILDDPELHDSVKEKITRVPLNAEAALFAASEAFCAELEAIEDEYFRARALDVRDVASSVMRVLLGITESGYENLLVPSVIIGRDITPSDCITLDHHMVLGFCTLEGGPTSHTTILARSLGVPALVGPSNEVLDLPDGATIALDGYKGEIIAEMNAVEFSHYESLRELKKQHLTKALQFAQSPAVTLDGHQVIVAANVEGVSAAPEAMKNGAEAVGLFRTEFNFLQQSKMPDEETQFKSYRDTLEAFQGRPVILRSLDIGGDKQLPYLDLPYELNPFLGVRGIRLCLKNRALFKTQLRAVLRAGYQQNLSLMYPMVAKKSEIFAAREILEECRQELIAEGKPVAENMPVGIMIEIPAAALLADQLADEVDFFSIGTNDLSQYTLAVDRTNPNLSDLANAFDPAVLRLIASVINAGHKKGKMVGVCGELAGEPLAIPILLGLGLDEFSMNSPAIPIAKQIIRGLNLADAKEVAQAVLEMETPTDVRAYVAQRYPFLNEL
jgi:phosphotransferase system enzyme I (PtsI)